MYICYTHVSKVDHIQESNQRLPVVVNQSQNHSCFNNNNNNNNNNKKDNISRSSSSNDNWKKKQPTVAGNFRGEDLNIRGSSSSTNRPLLLKQM